MIFLIPSPIPPRDNFPALRPRGTWPLPLPRSPSRAPQVTPSRCLIHWRFHIPSPAERAAAAQGGWQTHGRRRGSLPPARTRSKYVSVILLARRGRTGAGWEGFRQGLALPGVRTWDPSPTQKVLESQGGLPFSRHAVHLWEGSRMLGNLRNTGTLGTAFHLGGSWAAPFERGQCALSSEPHALGLRYECGSLVMPLRGTVLQRERPEWDGYSIDPQHTGPGSLSAETSLPMILFVPSGPGQSLGNPTC